MQLSFTSLINPKHLAVDCRYLQYRKYFCQSGSKIFLSKFPHLSSSAVSLYSWLCVLTVGSIISSRSHSTTGFTVQLRSDRRQDIISRAELGETRGHFQLSNIERRTVINPVIINYLPRNVFKKYFEEKKTWK